MIEEMIDSIIEAEDKAQEIVKASVNESNNIVNEAKVKADAMIVSAKDEQYAKEQLSVEAGEKKGAELRAAQLQDAQKQADEMISALEKNKKKVTASIIKELKGKYGIK
ncbi:MAG: hypothetical protein K2O31_06285 [Clostridia bacterium]|nr:hypothetical protein [Clostridia bacterium]